MTAFKFHPWRAFVTGLLATISPGALLLMVRMDDRLPRQLPAAPHPVPAPHLENRLSSPPPSPGLALILLAALLAAVAVLFVGRVADNPAARAYVRGLGGAAGFRRDAKANLALVSSPPRYAAIFPCGMA